MVALIVYQIGNIISGGAIDVVGLAVALVFIAVLLYFLFRPNKFKNAKAGVSSVKANS